MKHVLRIAVMATSLVAAAAQAAWVDVGLMSDNTTFDRININCDYRMVGYEATSMQSNIYPVSFKADTSSRYYFIVSANPSALRYILAPAGSNTSPRYAYDKIKEVANYLNEAETETARLRDMNLIFSIQRAGSHGLNYNKIYITSGVYKLNAGAVNMHEMFYAIPSELMPQYKLQQSC